MAHFAELDENNIVKRVIVVANSDCSINGVEDEILGVVFCRKLFKGGTWKQTSYNGNFREHFAGVGYTYDEEKDAFIPPQPYPSWALDADCNWQAPIACPTDGKKYYWDENTLSWIEVE